MRVFLILTAISLMLTGCSHISSPLIPTQDNPGSDTTRSGLMGVYELKLDVDNMTAELTTKRLSAIGESYIVSGLWFFTSEMCPTCFEIASIALTPDGYIELVFDITHPFEEGDPFKPPSALNRLDLDLFDVALVIVPVVSTPTEYSLSYRGSPSP